MVDCRRVNLSGGEFGVDIQEEDVCIRVLSCKGLEPRWIQRLEAHNLKTCRGVTVQEREREYVSDCVVCVCV